MRAVSRLFCAVAATVLVAVPAEAQRHEFGVDLGIASSKVDLELAKRVLTIGTPVDVRIGMVSDGPLSFEGRFSLAYMSSDGSSALSFDPGLNVLYRLGQSSRQGLYLTGGAKIAIDRVDLDSPGVDAETDTQIGINLGVGTRMPMGAAALRIEGFYAMMLEKGSAGESDFLPAVNIFGVRVGFSFWK